MLGSYFKIYIGNLHRNKMRSFLNIPGPGTGIACCLQVTFFGLYETNYDPIPKNASRIIPGTMEFAADGIVQNASVTGKRVFSRFAKDFPQAEPTV